MGGGGVAARAAVGLPALEVQSSAEAAEEDAGPSTVSASEPRDASRFLAAAGSQCVVGPRTRVSINGFERIEPEVFSLTAYEGAPDFDTRSKFNGLDFCREYGIEGIGFPANMAWVFDGDYWKKMTIAPIDQWFNEGHAEHVVSAAIRPSPPATSWATSCPISARSVHGGSFTCTAPNLPQSAVGHQRRDRLVSPGGTAAQDHTSNPGA